ncbi:hypothetical protein D3C81_1025160 [compost metagenome]
MKVIHLIGASNDLPNRQSVLIGEGEVTLIVGRHGHQGAFTIFAEHVTSNPKGDTLTGQRVLDVQTAGNADLDMGAGGLTGTCHLTTRLHLRLKARIELQSTPGKYMLGRNGTEGHPHERIHAGCEHPQFACIDQLIRRFPDLVGKCKTNTACLAYPVALHGANHVRPTIQ